MFGLSSMTIYRAISAGEFPAIRVRGRLFVPARAVDEMVATAIADQAVVEVILRFDRSVASRVAETTWHPTQSVTKNPDGSLTWRARVSGTLEIRPWILGWGADVEVVAPEALRAEVAEIVRAAAARYRRR